jgi:hypothetical protein
MTKNAKKKNADGNSNAQLKKLVDDTFSNDGKWSGLNEITGEDLLVAEFNDLWKKKEREWIDRLTPFERSRFFQCANGIEQTAFRVLRFWSEKDYPDFAVNCQALAYVLIISEHNAAAFCHRFCCLGIMQEVAPAIPRLAPARYKWIAGRDALRKRLRPPATTNYLGQLVDSRWQATKPDKTGAT